MRSLCKTTFEVPQFVCDTSWTWINIVSCYSIFCILTTLLSRHEPALNFHGSFSLSHLSQFILFLSLSFLLSFYAGCSHMNPLIFSLYFFFIASALRSLFTVSIGFWSFFSLQLLLSQVYFFFLVPFKCSYSSSFLLPSFSLSRCSPLLPRSNIPCSLPIYLYIYFFAFLPCSYHVQICFHIHLREANKKYLSADHEPSVLSILLVAGALCMHIKLHWAARIDNIPVHVLIQTVNWICIGGWKVERDNIKLPFPLPTFK